MSDTVQTQGALDETIDFLIAHVGARAIAEFRPSAAAQARVSALLDKNRQGELTPEEQAELDEASWVNHLWVLLRAQARS
jgi:hypothetical protein